MDVQIPWMGKVFFLLLFICWIVIVIDFWSMMRPGAGRKVLGIRLEVIYTVAWAAFMVLWIMGAGEEIAIIVCAVLTVRLAQSQAGMDLVAAKEKMIEEEYQEIHRMYTEMQCIRHDLKNHVLTVGAMLDGGEYEKIRGYLEEINDSVQAGEGTIFSGNGMVDAVLHTKTKSAQQANVRVDVASDLLEGLKIAEKDMCIILANLYDNAIEACRKVDENPWIEVRIARNKGMLLLKITNTFSEKPKKVGARLLTGKTDKMRHGFGLESVQRTVEKYDGTLETGWEEQVFTANVTFYDAF